MANAKTRASLQQRPTGKFLKSIRTARIRPHLANLQNCLPRQVAALLAHLFLAGLLAAAPRYSLPLSRFAIAPATPNPACDPLRLLPRRMARPPLPRPG